MNQIPATRREIVPDAFLIPWCLCFISRPNPLDSAEVLGRIGEEAPDFIKWMLMCLEQSFGGGNGVRFEDARVVSVCQ